jgi:hypothetical protein
MCVASTWRITTSSGHRKTFTDMSSLAAKARFQRLGGQTGTAVITPPPGQPPVYTQPMLPTVVDITTARTAAVTDNYKIIEFTNTDPIEYTIEAYATVPLPIGALLVAQQGDEGQVEFVAGAGVTFETSDSYKTRARESFIAMQHTSLNQWKALGDLESSIAALSVLGRAANSAGPALAIEADANLKVLIRRADALLFDLLGTSDITGLDAALAAKAAITYVDAADAVLAAAIAAKASITQVQQGTTVFVVAGGTANAMTGTTTPAVALTDGMQIRVRAVGANTITNPTFNFNGTGALTIFKFGGQALAASDIYGAGHEFILRYRASVPRWELVTPAASGSGGGASVIDSIADSDTTNAPSRNAVFDALALKAGLAGNTFSDEQITQHAGGTKRNRIDSAGGGQTSVLQTHGGLMLNTTAMNATNKYGHALLFGCLDVDFTTRNPKLLVAFAPFAREAFTADTAGGSGGEFFALPLAPGADPTPTSCGYFTTDGWAIPLHADATAVTPAAGDSSTKPATTAFVAAAIAAASGGFSGGPLVAFGETTLGADATSITSQTLDFSLYSSVRLEFAFDNASGSAVVLSLTANADSTATNYYEQAQSTSGATVSAARANDARIGNMDANETCTGFIKLKKDADGKVRAVAHINRSTPSGVIANEIAWVWNVVGNPTSFTISGSVATSIKSGAKLAGWGLKATSDATSGVAFPGSPTNGQRFLRTDLGIEFRYDGTRWLSMQIFTKEMRWTGSSLSITATSIDILRAGAPALQGGSDIYLLKHMCRFIVASGLSALSGSHKWVGDFHKYDSAVASTTVAGPLNIDSGASGTLRTIETTINALLGTGVWFSTTWTKTGTPGSLQSYEEISYRIVAT